MEGVVPSIRLHHTGILFAKNNCWFFEHLYTVVCLKIRKPQQIPWCIVVSPDYENRTNGRHLPNHVIRQIALVGIAFSMKNVAS
jgi:hypothetical protein